MPSQVSFNTPQPFEPAGNGGFSKNKKFWIIFFLICAVLVIASTILQLLTPKKVLNQENTWLGITPGNSTLSDVYKNLGQPLQTTQQPYGQELDYQSEYYKVVPNKVILDSKGEVALIQYLTRVDQPENISSYTEKFGQPELKTFSVERGSAATLDVYLSKGVAVLSHNQDGRIEQIWYFKPMSAADFNSTWKALVSENPEPERLEIP